MQNCFAGAVEDHEFSDRLAIDDGRRRNHVQPHDVFGGRCAVPGAGGRRHVTDQKERRARRLPSPDGARPDPRPSGRHGSTVPRTRAFRRRRRRRWEHVVVHRDHHRDEDDRVVEEMQLDAWNPELDDARRHRPTEEVVAERSPASAAARARCDGRTGCTSAIVHHRRSWTPVNPLRSMNRPVSMTSA